MLGQTKTIRRTSQGNWVVDLGEHGGPRSNYDPVACIYSMWGAGWDVLSLDKISDGIWECRVVPPPGRPA